MTAHCLPPNADCPRPRDKSVARRNSFNALGAILRALGERRRVRRVCCKGRGGVGQGQRRGGGGKSGRRRGRRLGGANAAARP